MDFRVEGISTPMDFDIVTSLWSYVRLPNINHQDNKNIIALTIWKTPPIKYPKVLTTKKKSIFWKKYKGTGKLFVRNPPRKRSFSENRPISEGGVSYKVQREFFKMPKHLVINYRFFKIQKHLVINLRFSKSRNT